VRTTERVGGHARKSDRSTSDQTAAAAEAARPVAVGAANLRDNRARPAHRRMLDTKCMNVHSTSQCSSTKNGGSMQVSNRAANALCDTRVAPGGSSASAACSKCSMLHPCSSPGVVWQRSVQQMQYATPVQLPGGRLPAQRAANAVCYTRAAPGGSSGNAACSKCSMLHPCSSRGVV